MAIPWKLTVNNVVAALEFYVTTTGTLKMVIATKGFAEDVVANVHHVLVYDLEEDTFSGEFMHSTAQITEVTGVIGSDLDGVEVADTTVVATVNFML